MDHHTYDISSIENITPEESGGASAFAKIINDLLDEKYIAYAEESDPEFLYDNYLSKVLTAVRLMVVNNQAACNDDNYQGNMKNLSFFLEVTSEFLENEEASAELEMISKHIIAKENELTSDQRRANDLIAIKSIGRRYGSLASAALDISDFRKIENELSELSKNGTVPTIDKSGRPINSDNADQNPAPGM